MDMREEFERNRGKGIYNDKISGGCANCKAVAQHLHHIVPLSLGGTNNHTNIVALCGECHGKVHGISGMKLHSQSTKKGIAVAKANGKRIGRQTGDKVITAKSIEAKKIILKHSKKFNGSLTDKEVMVLAKISKATFYGYVKELINEQE